MTHPRDAEPSGSAPPHDGNGTASAPEVWTGRATNRWQWLLAGLGGACMALGIELAVDSPWTDGLVPLVMSVVGCVAAGLLVLAGTLAFVHVAVRVDRDALEVRCGHIGVPRCRIPLKDVAAVSLAKVTPRQWGGWGYRWRPEKGTAVVVRRGPGVVIVLGCGRRFTVTVDDAEGAVRAIQARLRMRGGAPGTA